MRIQKIDKWQGRQRFQAARTEDEAHLPIVLPRKPARLFL